MAMTAEQSLAPLDQAGSPLDAPGGPGGPAAPGPGKGSLGRLVGAARADTVPARVGRIICATGIFIAVVQVIWNLTIGEFVDGIALGSLYGILAVGILLIYKTTRVINFAAAAVGAVPAVFALMLDVERHWSYLAVAPIAIIGGPIVGAIVDLLVMRKLGKSPRLVVTVATIGIAQSLGAVAFFIPMWLSDNNLSISNVPTPWQNLAWHSSRGQPILTGNQVAALVVTAGITIVLGAFLRFTRLGIALRATAENGDRAALLGVPTKLVGTAAWMIAGFIGSMAIFVQAPLIGVPRDPTLGFDTLLFALAAAVVAKMERIGVALGAGMGVGVLVFASVASSGGPDIASAIMLIVVLGALIVTQRGRIARAFDTGLETWTSLKHFRPIPRELRELPEVQTSRAAILLAAVGVAVGLGVIVSPANMPYLIELPIYGIVAVSLVILTGWAGQISLGQFGFVAAGAAVGGGLAANHNIDFFAAIGAGIATGAVVALVIGLPALRIQGLYLAVTTLAFAYAMEYYVLNPNYPIGAHILPSGYTAHLNRPLLWQRIDLSSNRSFYFVCLAFLALSMLAAYSFRRYRSGRVLIGLKDNQRAASVFAVNPIGSKLAAFAVSGGIAGMAGVLLAYSEYNVIPGAYDPLFSIFVFLAVVIGGTTSLPWAVAGVVLLRGSTLFVPQLVSGLSQNLVTVLPLLVTGPLLIVTVQSYPSGMAELGIKVRDKFLRRVAARHGIEVPSLVADRRVVDGSEDVGLVAAAGRQFAAGGAVGEEVQ
jgi:branched-chain amino acid transport system permease protein